MSASKDAPDQKATVHTIQYAKLQPIAISKKHSQVHLRCLNNGYTFTNGNILKLLASAQRKM
jgi:hypothetical protein